MNSEPSFTDCIRPGLHLCDPLQVLDTTAVSSIPLLTEHALMELRKTAFMGFCRLNKHSYATLEKLL